MSNSYNGLEIAIIGISCKMPGAANVREFWSNLAEKKGCISYLSSEDYQRLKISEDVTDNPGYVNCAGGQMSGKDGFDAAFFNIKPIEATLMDPQIRVFLESAWDALENAGYAPRSNDKTIGVYASAKSSFYWQAKTFFSEEFNAIGGYAASTLANRDFMSMTASYHLNLKGPSVFLHSTCSSSLAAVHLACQALNTGECEMALAGGVNLLAIDSKGYIHQEGMIYSADGHCRPFDEKASGIVEGEGVGVVVLKPLEDALRDRDHIYAVVKSSAVNNDGHMKLGFTAPSIQGQRKVIEMSHQVAGISSESISYIEAHGTGTAIGDPIEIEALTQAFRTSKKGFCGIGAVKASIGHLDAAAGIAGLIKTALAIHHRKMPPAVNYEVPNPAIDFENSPFYVNKELKEWQADELIRAGVSSFGIGGTNVHVVLEEAPSVSPGGKMSYNLLIISARDEVALQQSVQRLMSHLAEIGTDQLDDVCYTLQTGREEFPVRTSCVCYPGQHPDTFSFSDFAEVKASAHKVVFMFPGQGNQYKAMAKDLYEEEKVFRHIVDECFAILEDVTGQDFHHILFDALSLASVNDTAVAQPILFVIEYALARLLLSWGIKPDALIGHSIGEYTAACFAGVIGLRDCLELIALRGKLMQSMPAGSMISVNLGVKDIAPYLKCNIECAVINDHRSVVLSGDKEAINDCLEQMERDGHVAILLHTSHAFHSSMMERMLPEFNTFLGNLHFQEPAIRYISNLTGNWMQAEDIAPAYWSKHLRNTVQFAAGLDILIKDGYTDFIEVGPGNSLKKLVHNHIEAKHKLKAFSTLKRAANKQHDVAFLMSGLADLWMTGNSLSWKQFYKDQPKRRVPLPGYPFQRQRFWLDDSILLNGFGSGKTKTGVRKLSQWFYTPVWKQIKLGDSAPIEGSFIIFATTALTAKRIADRLPGSRKIIVWHGDCFKRMGSSDYKLNPVRSEDYVALWKDLSIVPEHFIDARGFEITLREADTAPFYSALALLQSFSSVAIAGKINLTFLVADMFAITGVEQVRPYISLLLGLVKVAPQEMPFLTTRLVDADGFHGEKLEALGRELQLSADADKVVALRNGRRWAQEWQQVEIAPNAMSRLRNGGVYLITGGTGKIGSTLINYLREKYDARIGVVTRNHNGGRLELDPEKCRMFQGHVHDPARMEEIVAEMEQDFGPVNGVFHLAGVSGTMPLEQTHESSCASYFQTKVIGAEVLRQVMGTRDVDFILLSSSLAAVLGGLGYTAYAAANGFMDAYANACENEKIKWLSVNFDGWHFTSSGKQLKQRLTIDPERGMEVIERALCFDAPQVAVSVTALEKRLKDWQGQGVERTDIPKKAVKNRSRPALSQPFSELSGNDEMQIAGILNTYFSYDKIGANDNFFDLGGDSLMALSVITRIHEQLGFRILIKDFYMSPSVRGLASLLNTAGNSKYKPVRPAERKEFYPLSVIQQRIYFACSLNPEYTHYNLSSCYLIKAKISVEQLEMALIKLVARHEVLRTSFVVINKAPRQVIHAHKSIRIEQYSLDWQNGGTVAEKAAIAMQGFVRPFRLNEAPLMRIGAAAVSEGQLLLMVDVHHIISDAVTANVILDEVVMLLNGQDPAPVKLHYKDFSEWHNRFLDTGKIERERQYWVNKFRSARPFPGIPTDFPRPDLQRYEADTLYLDIPPELTIAIKDSCSQTGSGLFIFMLAAANILFHKYTGEESIILGTETAGRIHADIQHTAGMFVGLLPLRHTISPLMTFAQFMASVKENTLDDLDHQLFQFNDLVSELNIKGRLDSNPLFNTIVSLDNISTAFSNTADASRKGIDGYKIEYRQKNTIWDMRFGIVDLTNSIIIRLDYSIPLYSRNTMELLSARYRHVMEVVTANKDILISDIMLPAVKAAAFASASDMREEIEFNF